MGLAAEGDVTWAKLDGPFWVEPRFLQVGNAATGVFARALSYCAKYRLDRIPVSVVDLIAAEDPRALAALEEIGALVIDEDPHWYRLDPPPEVRSNETARRKREAEASGHATAAQVQARVEFYGGLCWICRVAPYESIDHVKPIFHGGSKWPSNLRPACKSCNSRKGSRWPFERGNVVTN